jgi:thioredoxin 1
MGSAAVKVSTPPVLTRVRAIVRCRELATYSGMSKMPVVTEESFVRDVLESEVPVLLDFGATWCGPCKALEPILEKLARELGDRVKVLAIDADDCASIAARYKVRAVPTIISFVGGKEHKRHTGVASQAVLSGLLPA